MEWLDKSGHDLSDEGEEGDAVECKMMCFLFSRAALIALDTDQTLVPLLLEKITSSSKGIQNDQIKYISHRM